MPSNLQEIDNLVTKINENFQDERTRDAFFYYYLQSIHDSEFHIQDYDLKKNLASRLESSLVKQYHINSWTNKLAKLFGYKTQFLIQQKLCQKNIIYDNYSPYDQKINLKLKALAHNAAVNFNTSSATVEQILAAKGAFTELLNFKFSNQKDENDLIKEFSELDKKTYITIYYKLLWLIKPQSAHPKLEELCESNLQQLMTFLLDAQDLYYHELNGVSLLKYIQNHFFNSITPTDDNYHLALEKFSKFLVEIFLQLQNSPIPHYSPTKKAAVLNHYKTLVNQFSDYYQLPYRIQKIDTNSDTGKQLTTQEILIHHCNTLIRQLNTHFNDHQHAQDYSNMDEIDLKRLEKKLVTRLNTYYQALKVAQQCATILTVLEDIKPSSRTDNSQDLVTLYSQECQKILKNTAHHPEKRLQAFQQMRTTISKHINMLTETSSAQELNLLAWRLLSIYPYAPQNRYSHKQKFEQECRQIDEMLPRIQNKEKIVADFRRLVVTINKHILEKHLELNPQIVETSANQNFIFGYEQRSNSYAAKKARRTDKSIIFHHSWPLVFALAFFQAAIAGGGIIEYLSPYLALSVALGVGTAGFIFSYFSNAQLVSLPLYRLLVDVFIDNRVSRANSTVAKAFFKAALVLCLGTGLTMAIVALSFSIGLFANPSITLLLGLATIDIIPTTLGFGALMFKTFESTIYSIIYCMQDLTWKRLKFISENAYEQFQKATLEDKGVLILTWLLTPIVIVAALSLTIFATAGMIGAWYFKVSTFLSHYLNFTPWASALASLILVGSCATPIRGFFNTSNILWMGFFVSELISRYCIVKPLLLPFNIAHYLRQNSDILGSSMIHPWTHVWKNIKADPLLYWYRLEYRMMRSFSVTGWLSLTWTCVIFNAIGTGMAAVAGGLRIRNMTGLDLDTSKKISIASNTSLSLGANGRSLISRMQQTPSTTHLMPLASILNHKSDLPATTLHQKTQTSLAHFNFFKPDKTSRDNATIESTQIRELRII